MSDSVVVIVGPARSGKARRVLGLYSEALARGARAIMLVPTQQRRKLTIRRLLDATPARAAVRPNVFTFEAFAEAILAKSSEPIRLISPTRRRAMIRSLLDGIKLRGEAGGFAPLVDSPGLITALDSFVSELKRAQVAPDAFSSAALARRASSDKDNALGLLYRAYQRRLQAEDLYDDEGRFWRVKQLLADGFFAPFEGLELVVVDGFQDFTAAQIDILEHLAGRCREMVFTLTLDRGRRDLFAVTERTLARLEELFKNGIRVEEMPGEAKGLPPDLQHLRLNLFAEPGSVESARASGAVSIISAAGAVRETEAIARRIKDILAAGDVAPGQTAVIVRSLSAYEDIIREVFPRYGIRFAPGAGLPLMRCPAVRAAVALLDMPASNYARRDVMRFIKSAYFNPASIGFERADVDLVDRLTREANVFVGMESYFAGLRWLRSSAEGHSGEAQGEDEEPRPEVAEKLDDTNRAEEFLKALFALFDDFPASAHRRTFVERLRGLLVGLKFEAGAGGAGTHGKRDRVEDELLLRRDVLSLESFNGVLRDICETEDAGGEVKLDVFRRELVSALSAVRIPAYEPAGAPVVVFDVQHCRALSFEHVFLMGLSEHGFPNIRREHPFYDEQAREELRDGGVRLQRMVETEEQEMLLFYLAVTRARTSLTLSYPSADARGRQVLPSQYLDELEALFSPADESGHGIERQSVGLGDLDLSIEHARSVREARSWLFCNYWAAGKTRQPGLSEHLLHHFCESDPPTRAALAGLAAERERERGKVFGPFDGMLADEGIIERLQRQYPGERPMSASQFETFGQCSWKFFARYILRLESLEEPTEELGPMDVGQIYHALLRRFFTALRASSVGTKITAGNRDAALKILDAEAEAYFGHLQRTGRIGSPTLWKVQRRQAIEDLQALVDWEMENPGKFGEGLAPAYFEAEFGQERQFRDTEISTVEPLIFKTLWGPLRLRGRIDRVDVARRDGEVEALAVIDYKTGQAPKKKWMLEGISFQLPVYLRAATELLMPGVRDAQASAAFFSIRGCGPRNAIKRFDSKGEESDYYLNVMKSAEEYIRRWVAGIREGAFPVFPRTDCGRCEFDDACRYFRWRIDAKEQPEGLGKIVWDESEDA